MNNAPGIAFRASPQPTTIDATEITFTSTSSPATIHLPQSIIVCFNPAMGKKVKVVRDI